MEMMVLCDYITMEATTEKESSVEKEREFLAYVSNLSEICEIRAIAQKDVTQSVT